MTRFLDWIGYLAVVYGPWRITCSADNFIGRWCLPRAGGHAYRNMAGRV
jgi:hypothetical protein